MLGEMARQFKAFMAISDLSMEEEENMWIRSKRSEAWHRVRVWSTWTSYITICGRKMIAAEKTQKPLPLDALCLQCYPFKESWRDR